MASRGIRPALERADHSMGKWFGLWVVGACCAGIAFSASVAPLARYSALLLFYNMAVTSLGATFGHFRVALRSLSVLIAASLILYGVMPALAYVLSLAVAPVSSDMAAGIVLLMAVPAGITGAVWTGLARGRVSLAITIVIMTTMVSSVVTPGLVKVLAGVLVQVDAARLAWTLLWIVTVPVLLGTTLNSLWRPRVDAVRAPLRLGVKLSIMAVVAANVATLTAGLSELSLRVLLLLGAVQVGLLVAGHALGYLVGSKVSPGRFDDVVALTYTAGMRNHVSAVALASAYFPPHASIPILLSMLFLHAAAGLVSAFLRVRSGARQRPAAEHGVVQAAGRRPGGFDSQGRGPGKGEPP